MNQKPRPKGKLIEALMNEAGKEVTAKGGWGATLRRHRDLMREAALELAKWGRPSDAKRRQPGDLFRQAAE